MQKKDLPFLALKLNKLFPEAKTELHYSNKFQLLIAILLSAQTTDTQVNKATDKLFKILRTPEDGVAL
jgi:endonuclease-3